MCDFFVAAEELMRLLGTDRSPIIRDVRPRPAYDADPVVLPTARWRDPAALDVWGRQLSRADPVVIACARGGADSQQAAAVLRQRGWTARVLAGGIERWQEAGLPTIIKAALPGRDETSPSRWVTRVRPKIDRIACPWLISRFIDREAEFLFAEPAHVVAVAKALGGIAYDIDGVEISHDGPLCSFDTLLRRFGLRDPALDALALIVRGADTASLDLAPQAAGLLAISLGISALAGEDDGCALAKGFPVYDALLAWQRHAPGETHNWPSPKRA